MPEKTITIRIEDELHTNIKMQATKEGKSIKDYLVELVLKDLENK